MSKYLEHEIAPKNHDEDCMYWTNETGFCAICGEETHAWSFVEYICSHECRSIAEKNIYPPLKEQKQAALDEYNYHINNKTCCACTHFHWGMGEMGYCDLKKYKCCTEAGEWSDSCDIDQFEEIPFKFNRGELL